MRKTLILALLCSLWLLPAPAHAQQGLTLQASAGWDGAYKIQSWVPVHIVAVNEGSDVRGELQVSVDTGALSASVLTVHPVELPGPSRKEYTLYVLIETFASQVHVRLVERERTLYEISVPLRPLTADTFLCGVVSDDPTALSTLSALPALAGRRVQVAHLSTGDIPRQGRVLDGLDALIVHDSDTTALHPAQQSALQGWVAMGGHLVACGGPNAMQTAAGLGDLLPVQIGGSRTTTDLGSLGDAAEAPWMPGLPAVVAEVVPRSSPPLPRPVIAAGEEDLPLWVSQARGRGRVDYLAVDPDQEPLRTWVGIQALWSAILSAPPAAGLSPWTTDVDSSWSSLQEALTAVSGMGAPSVLLVIAFLFAYVALVGPINFFVLKRLDRQALAWVTASAIILIFTVAAGVTGLVTRGRQLVLSQVSIVQAQPAAHAAAVDTLAGLYSPFRRSYDVRLGDYALVRQVSDPYDLLSPGTGEKLRVEQGAPTRVRALQLDVGEMRDMTVQRIIPWQAIESDLWLERITDVDPALPTLYRIEGTLSNTSQAAIRHNALVYGAAVIPIGDLAPGQRVEVSVDVDAAEIKSAPELLSDLVEPGLAAGEDRRTVQRRRSTLEALLMPYLYGRAAAQSPLRGLTLIGWPEEGPAQIEVDQIASRREATTLLVAPLSVSTQIGGRALLPKGFAAWELVDGDPGTTPHQLYPYHSPPTFRYTLASPQAPEAALQAGAVERLVLHLNAPTPIAPPQLAISIRDAGSGEWVDLPRLDWGANPIPDPGRYVSEGAWGGRIEVRVQTQTMGGTTISLDVEAVGGPLGSDH